MSPPRLLERTTSTLRSRIPTLLAAGLLAASLSACSSDDESDVALPSDPGNASTDQDATGEGSTDGQSTDEGVELMGEVDPAHCDVVRDLDEWMDELQVSAEANHELGGQPYVEEKFAPVEEVINEMPPAVFAALVVLDRVASSAVMPMTDQEALDERFANEETTQAMAALDEARRQACGE